MDQAFLKQASLVDTAKWGSKSSMDEEEQIKEVYAAFGLAAYGAQVFERQLGITLATAWGSGPSQITQAQYDALLEQYFHKTAGQLRDRETKPAKMGHFVLNAC